MKLNIGFSFNLGNAGPSNFLNNLKRAFSKNKIAKTSYFLSPFSDCNIYSNAVRNPWNKPYIFRVDGIGYDKSRSKEHLKAMNNMIIDGINNAKGVVYQTEHSKKLAEKILDIKPKKSTVIINGTNLNKFNPKGDNFRSELNIPTDALVFISSAKWRPHKRLIDVIETYKLFRKQYNEESFLILLGEDNEKDELNNIIHIPFVANEDMPKYLRSANIYLFFSWVDFCPNSVVEAIACNLPVICTNQGGTKEIIKATNGGIVVNADSDFNYELTDLQKPPKPDYKKILQAMKIMVKDLDHYKKQIDTTRIDINYVAKAYYNFLMSCYE